MQKRNLWLASGGIAFFSFYTIFWIQFFIYVSDKPKHIPFANKVVLSSSTQNVLSTTSQNLQTPSSVSPQLPEQYLSNIDYRRQKFNLSCEFAAASAIIYQFTHTSSFDPVNEEHAEKLLISQIGVSANPNIGVRMGTLQEDIAQLYSNLNEKFGGSDYYGVHAPPFIDLFAKYHLRADPIPTNGNTLNLIKRAISSSHLVMTWIKIGYQKPIDVALTYGNVPIIRGEHVVVVYGYDSSGVWVMDPGIGAKRHIVYQQFADSMQEFSMPMLEVYPVTDNSYFQSDPTGPTDAITQLNRQAVKISLLNGATEVGGLSRIAEILHDYGYQIFSQKQTDAFTTDGIAISIKKSFSDYSILLKKDLQQAFYTVSSVSTELPEDSSEDVIIRIGS